VGIVMSYGLDGRSSIPGRGKDFSLLQSVQTGSRADSASSPVSVQDRDVKLTTHLYLVPRSRMVELYFNCPTRLHGVVLN
jgi:hypothetical protein